MHVSNIKSNFILINIFISENCLEQFNDCLYQSNMLLDVREDLMKVTIIVLSFWNLVSSDCLFNQMLFSVRKTIVNIWSVRRSLFLRIDFIFKLHVKESMRILSWCEWILNRIVSYMNHLKLHVFDHLKLLSLLLIRLIWRLRVEQDCCIQLIFILETINQWV